MSRLGDLWARRHEIMPTASEDEIQEAFTYLLECIEYTGTAWPDEAILRERGLDWRRKRAHITINEIPSGDVHLEDESVLEAQEVSYFKAPTYEDGELADVLDKVLREATPETAQAYILVELRGVPLDKAAALLGRSTHSVGASVNVVNQALRRAL